MKSISQIIEENTHNIPMLEDDKQFNIVRRLGVYEGILTYLAKAGKIDKSTKQVLQKEFEKFPLPSHLESDNFIKSMQS